jgi:hypothetical protein
MNFANAFFLPRFYIVPSRCHLSGMYLTFHRIRCIVSDMTTWEIHFPFSSTGTIRKAKAISSRLVGILPFTGTTRQDFHDGDLGASRNGTCCSLRHDSKGRVDVKDRAPMSKRDLNRVIRSDRAVRRVPLDVEIARSLVTNSLISSHAFAEFSLPSTSKSGGNNVTS